MEETIINGEDVIITNSRRKTKSEHREYLKGEKARIKAEIDVRQADIERINIELQKLD